MTSDQRQAAYAVALTSWRDHPSKARLPPPSPSGFGLTYSEALEIDRVILEGYGEWDFSGLPDLLQPRPRLLKAVPEVTGAQANRRGWRLGKVMITTAIVAQSAGIFDRAKIISEADMARHLGWAIRLKPWLRRRAPGLALVIAWQQRPGHPPPPRSPFEATAESQLANWTTSEKR